MILLENNNGVRIEYRDFDNEIYLYKDITKDFMKSLKKKNRDIDIQIDNLPKDNKTNNLFNEVAHCHKSNNSCLVYIRKYLIENGINKDDGQWVTIDLR